MILLSSAFANQTFTETLECVIKHYFGEFDQKEPWSIIVLPLNSRIKFGTSLLENSAVRLRFLPCTCIVTRSAFHLGLLMFPNFGRKIG